MTSFIPEINLYSEARIPLAFGVFWVQIYRISGDNTDIIVILKGQLAQKEKVFTRVHSQCFTGEVLGSLRCDCKEQLQRALREIAKLKQGIIVYLSQEGRGIGLADKIKAYALQDLGQHDTVSANHALGFANDLRNFSAAAAVLKKLQVKSIVLNTNNPDKISSLKEHNITIDNVVPSHTNVNIHNRNYLLSKHKKLGHNLGAKFNNL